VSGWPEPLALTAATRLSKKLNPLQLAKMFGWKDVDMAQTYYRETAADVAQLWAELNKHPGWSRHVAAPSAVMLFGELARFCDKHKPTAPQPTPAQS